MQMPFPASIFTKALFVPWREVRIETLPPVLGIRRAEVRVKGYPRPIRFFGDPGAALLARELEVRPNNALQATREDARA